MEWISVKDRLPEYDERIIILDKCKSYGVSGCRSFISRLKAKRESSKGIGLVFENPYPYVLVNVTHWMPDPAKACTPTT